MVDVMVLGMTTSLSCISKCSWERSNMGIRQMP